MSDNQSKTTGPADFPEGATDELARIQRGNRCVRSVCSDMRSEHCDCMREWQAWLNARRPGNVH